MGNRALLEGVGGVSLRLSELGSARGSLPLLDLAPSLLTRGRGLAGEGQGGRGGGREGAQWGGLGIDGPLLVDLLALLSLS